MLVMTDEIIAMTRRIMRGIEISDDTLMLDLIDQVGPVGEFMSTEETARRCRAEMWVPKLMDRQPWPNWEAAGATSMIRPHPHPSASHPGDAHAAAAPARHRRENPGRAGRRRGAHGVELTGHPPPPLHSSMERGSYARSSPL